MSADLQWAAKVFGALAILHVLDRGPLPEVLRDPDPQLFASPLPETVDAGTGPVACAGAVIPLVVGRGSRAESLDVGRDDLGPVRAADFPLPLVPEDSGPGWDLSCWEPEGRWLIEEVEIREREGHQLLSNFLAGMTRRGSHEPWPGLLRMPPRILDRLHETEVGPGHHAWLGKLPKAELHLHLGGCLEVTAQRAVGRAVWEALGTCERAEALDQVGPLLHQGRWNDTWPDVLRPGHRAHDSAALLCELGREELEERLFPPDVPRVALRDRHPLGFRAYELPGELTGSAILGHEAAVFEYARQVHRALRAQGIVYAELRGSPAKYLGGEGLRFLELFRQGLDAAEREDPGCKVHFVVIVDRRSIEEAGRNVRLAVSAHERLEGFVVGLDLAGEESATPAQELASAFQPAFEACLKITIHAGEGEPAGSIWNAAYALHADRIGHGLTLADRPTLADRFRDRGICLELCPSSNVEVVGFHDPGKQETEGFRPYPLRELLDLELPLTLCTDNPGISRTELASEYVRASRMVGGLRLWEALGMIRKGFEHAFLPTRERRRLLQDADRRLREMLQEEESP